MTVKATSVRAIFFDSPSEAVAAMTTAVRYGEAGAEIRDALGRMPDATKGAVLAEVGKAAAEIMEFDVTDVFRKAWERHSALRRAAAATGADPDSEHIMELATHTMSLTHRPSVELHIEDLPAVTIGVHVRLNVTVRGMLAVVRGGRLVAIRAGSGDVTGRLTLADREVAQRRVTLALPITIRLDEGLSLPAGPVQQLTH